MVDVLLHLLTLRSIMHTLKLRKSAMVILYSTSFYFRHIFGIVRQSLVSTFSGMAPVSFTRPRGRTCTPDIMQVSLPLMLYSIKLQPIIFHDPHH